MCLVNMADKPKSDPRHHQRQKRTAKLGSKYALRFLRMEDVEAYKPWRAVAVRGAIRKCLRRQQRRAQRAKLAGTCADMGQGQESRYEATEGPALWPRRARAPGEMAPGNTTQYLMSIVYDDLLHHPGTDADGAAAPSPASAQVYAEALSPQRVYSALDTAYSESCLRFQQRDFEEVYSRTCA